MDKVPGSAHLNFTIGGLIVAGGAMGFFRRGSTMSLVAGLGFGGIMIGSGVLISKGECYDGHRVGAAASGVLTAAMGQRFLASGKFMPSGLVATIGAVGLAYNVQKAIEWKPDPKQAQAESKKG